MILLVNRVHVVTLIGEDKVPKSVYLSDTPIKLFPNEDLAESYCKNLGLKRSKIREVFSYDDKSPKGIIDKMGSLISGEISATSSYVIHKINVTEKVVKKNIKDKPKIKSIKKKDK